MHGILDKPVFTRITEIFTSLTFIYFEIYDRKCLYLLGWMTSKTSTRVQRTLQGNNIFPYLSALLLYYRLVCVAFTFCLCVLTNTVHFVLGPTCMSVSFLFSVKHIKDKQELIQTRHERVCLLAFFAFSPFVVDFSSFHHHAGRVSHVKFSLFELPPADHKVAQLWHCFALVIWVFSKQTTLEAN